ncbi:hypothetical protein [Vulgatibacter sp.]|uniref:hypothetical protein n=1 Tax=Vulgatibacter sp. TaxID=1971226 RepID=UPI00356A5E6B
MQPALKRLVFIAVATGLVACTPTAGRLLERNEAGGSIIVGDRPKTLERVARDCGGGFTIVAEREAIVSGHAPEDDDEPLALALVRTLGGHEEPEESYETVRVWDYRCTERRSVLGGRPRR